jgi:hypothetical protein
MTNDITRVLTLKEVATVFQCEPQEIERLVASGELAAFPFAGSFRTTQEAVDRYVTNQMAKAEKVRAKGGVRATGVTTSLTIELRSEVQLPTLNEIRQLAGVQVAPIKYRSRNGQEVEWNETAFSYLPIVNGKEVPIVVAIFGPLGGLAKGVRYPYWGGETYIGQVGHGLRAVNEWIRTDDYPTTGRIASVIKVENHFAKAGEVIDPEYSQLAVDDYSKVTKRSNMRRCQCVVAQESDHAVMVLHALIRCRQNGLLK